MKRVAALGVLALLASYAPPHDNSISTYSTDDPALNTAERQQVRVATIGIGAGLLLEPFGLPLAANAGERILARGSSSLVFAAAS